ncbi:hypothetical protein PMI42_00126 [Bradyrhizobium sp. YR681]|nr:hypothetical protein PMI42_00126 [Bradyrhizobium sp. YR681]
MVSVGCVQIIKGQLEVSELTMRVCASQERHKLILPVSGLNRPSKIRYCVCLSGFASALPK